MRWHLRLRTKLVRLGAAVVVQVHFHALRSLHTRTRNEVASHHDRRRRTCVHHGRHVRACDSTPRARHPDSYATCRVGVSGCLASSAVRLAAARLPRNKQTAVWWRRPLSLQLPLHPHISYTRTSLRESPLPTRRCVELCATLRAMALRWHCHGNTER